MLQVPGGDSVGTGEYQVIDQLSTVQVNPNNTVTPIEQITIRDTKYGVVATFNVTQATFLANGAKVLASERAAQIQQLVASDHVIGARGQQDQDPATGQLFNYLVLVVGTADGSRSTEIQVRMDHLGLPASFSAITAAYKNLLATGPSGSLVV